MSHTCAGKKKIININVGFKIYIYYGTNINEDINLTTNIIINVLNVNINVVNFN